MNLTARSVIEGAAVLGAVSSLGFYLLSGCGIASFLLHRRDKSASNESRNLPLPPVSILKPLKGLDPQMWEAFCSHCEQDYPEFELIFGVSDPNDPAIALVLRLQEKYPRRKIDLLVCPRDLGNNRKLGTLAQMLPSARHEVLLLNDSDIRVPPDYLRLVGLVTCLYRGIPRPTVGSRLEALGISTDFVPGVLSARLIEGGLHFGLGSTLAFRRSDLQAIGGFEAFVDYLADDYEIGNRIARLGKRIELSEVVVETFLPAYSFREYVDHQLRWARSVRAARSWGYAGLILTFGLPWATLALLAGREALWAWWLFVVTVAARTSVGLTAAVAGLDDTQPLRDLFLLPLRDLIAPVIWAAGLVGNRIFWRGDEFYLNNGRLERVTDVVAAREESPRLSRP